MNVPDPGTSTDSLAELRRRVETALDHAVRPELQADGGDVEVVGVDEDRIVQIRLSGTCQGCSSASIVLAMQIEATVKSEVPEVRFLELVP